MDPIAHMTHELKFVIVIEMTLSIHYWKNSKLKSETI